MNYTSSEYDIYYDELINLISGNTDIASQYIIFKSSDDNYYAINVAKVEELIRNKDIELTKSSGDDDLTLGIAKIRDDFVVLLYFDDWINKKHNNLSNFPLIIICLYGNKKIGLIVKDVIGIQSLNVKNIQERLGKDKKVSQIVEVVVNGKRKLCNIFDYDRLVLDIFSDEQMQDGTNIDKEVDYSIDLSSKMILVAEDSPLVQAKLQSILNSIGVNFEIFKNGKELLDSLENKNPDEISLIITDVEMPTMDGISLIQNLMDNEQYSSIPVLIHTNMANSAIRKKAKDYDVKDIITKFDNTHLKSSIYKFIR